MKIDRVPHVGEETVDGTLVLYIRSFLPKADISPEYGAQTTLYLGKTPIYCKEAPDVVASMADTDRAAAGMLSLAQLHSANGWPIWFAGEKSEGPVHLYPGEIRDGVRSAFRVGELVSRVSETPEQVYALVKSKGGVAPPVRPAFMERFIGVFRGWLGTQRTFEGM
ncbi:hypothetical protein ELH24_37780 [Rhizobium ruizarguesonis]|uniref:hypothetical protein n=1 Tax=Rhizobium ruizarguesonis TaxID=2081791 RepID=UPI00102FB1A3|nr:hypothetical protein [Rhizobium ruizarguesonis]TBD07654.1 hypothetical protein ELH24_37780 [Rhizobium ruizarguesonis]